MGFPIPSFQADVGLKSKEKNAPHWSSQQCFYRIYLYSNLSLISGFHSFGRYSFFMYWCFCISNFDSGNKSYNHKKKIVYVKKPNVKPNSHKKNMPNVLHDPSCPLLCLCNKPFASVIIVSMWDFEFALEVPVNSWKAATSYNIVDKIMCRHVCHMVCEVCTLVTSLLPLMLRLLCPRKGIPVKLLDNCRWNIKVVGLNPSAAHWVIIWNTILFFFLTSVTR